MKIIQSFAAFEKGAPRAYGSAERDSLSFYSFLLSYLTLKKYYGSVRMYCNQRAKDKLIKYIPYDEVKIVENKNDEMFWSYYKVDVIKSMRTDFIHVDSDVFIFADLFSEFMKNKKYDIIVQNHIPENINYVGGYVNNFRDFVVENNIIDTNIYDGRCCSCGVLGMRHEHKKSFIEMCESIKKGFMSGKTDDKWFIGMASEELALYFAELKYGWKSYEILPYKDLLKYGEQKAGDYHHYTHMYLDSKFQPKYVKLIRNKILKAFPDAKKYVDEYEKTVMKASPYLNALR
jgi:hypothetical protein